MQSAQTRQAAKLSLPVADWFVVLAGFLFATSALPILLGPGAESESGSPVVRASYLLVYAASLVLLVRAGAFPAALLRAPLLLAVLAWPVASVFWSVAPAETAERLIGLLGCSALGIFIGWHHDGRTALRLLAWSMLWAVVLSALAVALVPAVGIDSSGGPWAGAWLGLHLHKNALGATASLAMLALLSAALGTHGWRRRVFALGTGLALALLLGARSTTALLAGGGAFLLLGALLVVRRMPGLGLVAALVVLVNLVIFGVLAAQLDLVPKILASLGKSETLSSRVPLWQLSWLFVEERFWLGYGYDVFWLPDLSWTDLIEARLNFAPFYSHNGVVELWLGGGLIAVLLVGSLYALTVVRSLLWFVRHRAEPEAAFPIAFLGYLALQNFSEATLLMRNDLSWIVFVSLAVRYGRLVQVRHRAPASARRPDSYPSVDATSWG